MYSVIQADSPRLILSAVILCPTTFYLGGMTSLFQSFPLLRKAAPRLSKQFFICHRCRRASIATSIASRATPRPKPTSPFLKAFKSRSVRASSEASAELSSSLRIPSPLSSLSRTIDGSQSKKAFFPEISEKIVAYWLLGSAASVFCIVVFGGLTRLTESGLDTVILRIEFT